MKRRTILGASTAAAIAAPAFAQGAPSIRWRMPSSFPKTLDTVHGAGAAFAEIVRKLTDGKFVISVHGPGELVPPLAILEAVSGRSVDCGHTASFFYIGREPALVFDTGVPFGMNPRQHTAWMAHGGGSELIQGIYDKYDVVHHSIGGTGAQMGGWFRKEIKTPADLKGLRMRVPGLLGKMYAKLGVIPQNIPPGEVYQALEKGTLDAAEFVGPYDDERLGLSKVAKFYYAPGVVELNASLCMLVNKKAWAELPDAYKLAIETACAQSGQDMLAKYDAKNPAALRKIVGGGATLSYWPKAVMDAMYKASQEVLEEEARANATFAAVHAKWSAFRDEQLMWAAVNDGRAEQYLLSMRNQK